MLAALSLSQLDTCLRVSRCEAGDPKFAEIEKCKPHHLATSGQTVEDKSSRSSFFEHQLQASQNWLDSPSQPDVHSRLLRVALSPAAGWCCASTSQAKINRQRLS